MNQRDLLMLKIELEYPQPRTRLDITSEIRNWVSGDPDSAFDYAVEQGLIEKTGEDYSGTALWKATKKFQTKSLQAKKKENWITTEKGHKVLIPEGREKGEYIKEYFEKLNKKNKSEKPFLKDAKSKKKYKQIRDVLKDHRSNEIDLESIARDILGVRDVEYKTRDGTRTIKQERTLWDVIDRDESDPEKRKRIYERLDQLRDIYTEKSPQEFDKEFDKYVKEFGGEKLMEDRKLFAQAYNDYMEETMADKNTTVYRFVRPEEFVSILNTGKFRMKPDHGKADIWTPKNAPPNKSWTLNKRHRFSNMNTIRLEVKATDYDFKIIKATPYVRRYKTVKDGQSLDDYDGLVQKEVRLDVGKGLDIKKNITMYVPKGFFKDPIGKIRERFDNKLLKTSGFTIKEDPDIWWEYE